MRRGTGSGDEGGGVRPGAGDERAGGTRPAEADAGDELMADSGVGDERARDPGGASPLRVHGGVVARNTVLNLLGQGLPLVVAVLTLPPIVRGMGEERFGILAIVWMLVAYVGDLGFGRATTKYAAEVLGRAERHRLPAIVWTTVAVQAGFGIAAGVALALATPLLVERVLEIPPALVTEARISFHLLAWTLPAIALSNSLRGVLEAAQRFDLVNYVRVPSKLANFILPLVGLALGWVLPGIVALLLGARVAVVLAHYALGVRLFPGMARPRFERAELRAVFAFGSWLSVSSLISPLLVFLDRFMLGALVAMSAVAYYTAPFELVARLWLIPTAMVATLFPAFSTLGGRSEWDRVQAFMSRSIKYVLFLLGPAVLFVIANAGDILDVWMGADFARESTLALQILGVGVLINSLAHIPSSFLQGIGRPDLTAKFHLIELPVQLVLAWALVSAWGIPGAAAAWTLRVTLDAALLFEGARRVAGFSMGAFVGERVPQTAAVLVMFGAAATVAAMMLPALWMRVGVVTTLLCAVALIVWRYSLGAADRARIARLFPAGGGR